jgi:dipeptidase E
MRLFLSSYRAGEHQAELIKLASGIKNVAVITNAKDDKTTKERIESVNEVLDFFIKLGFKPKEIDLRPHFKKPETSKKELQNYKFVWMAGGNTFLLRRALKYTGLDEYLIKKVKDDVIIYGGESAGAILATPTFTGVEFGDDPKIIPKGYKKEIILEGLNLVPYHIVPHYQSEWEGAKDMIVALKKKKLEYKTLTDNQVMVINGKKEEFLK